MSRENIPIPGQWNDHLNLNFSPRRHQEHRGPLFRHISWPELGSRISMDPCVAPPPRTWMQEITWCPYPADGGIGGSTGISGFDPVIRSIAGWAEGSDYRAPACPQAAGGGQNRLGWIRRSWWKFSIRTSRRVGCARMTWRSGLPASPASATMRLRPMRTRSNSCGDSSSAREARQIGRRRSLQSLSWSYIQGALTV